VLLDSTSSAACTPREVPTASTASKAYRATKYITYNNVGVDLVIDKPANDTVDVLVAYHGTVFVNSKILEAAGTTLDRVKAITMRQDMMIVSVAYPEEGLLFGDNIRESEAALLWVKQKASAELGVVIKKVFLEGHSQGGYIVTRLNTMHTSDGVVANALGPLNLALRCQLEETNQLPGSPVCALLRNSYGSARTNPQPYNERSLLNFTNNFKADILFTQGLQDAQIQFSIMASFSTASQSMHNMPTTYIFGYS
jgi:hypothetical protein